MTTNDIAFVAFVVSALTLFGGVLGWASWEEGRNNRKRNR